MAPCLPIMLTLTPTLALLLLLPPAARSQPQSGFPPVGRPLVPVEVVCGGGIRAMRGSSAPYQAGDKPRGHVRDKPGGDAHLAQLADQDPQGHDVSPEEQQPVLELLQYD